MKKKLAEMIIRFRILLLVLILTLAAASVFMISKTTINYDLTRYLSEDTMTRRALAVMEQEFGSSEQLRIMFVDQDEGFLEKAVRDLNALPEIFLAAYDAEENRKETNGKMYQLVTLTLDDCDAAVLVKSLREMFPEAGEYYVGGSAAMQLDVQNSVGREIPEVMVIAVIVVLAVLLLTSHAWLEPFLILFVLAVSIIINMGTNFIFKDVSFITFAVSAILQLALSIDYAIMLLHTYNGLRAGGADGRSAMTEALTQCFMRISSSALTTIAGLLSLLFMSFTIGFDIGMVLSKGILISMLCVFLLMPSVTLLMEKPLIRTRHKPIRLGGEHLARGVYRIRKPLAAVLTIAVLLFAYLNTRITYTFTDSGATDAGESALINGVFGRSNPLVLLIPGGGSDEDYEKQRALVQRLTDLKRENEEAAVTAVSSMVTTGEAALTYYTPQEVAEMTGLNEMIVRAFFALQGFGDSVRADHLLDSAKALTQDNETVTELVEMLDTARSAFVGPHYDRMLLEIPFTAYDKDFNACMEGILSTAEEFYGEDYYVTGMGMSSYDIGNAFQGDLLRVNLITLLAILLIVVISFRAIKLPLLLVFVIEGAIWITMGLSVVLGQPIFFISYLLTLAMQMGATIDYGILLCDQYRLIREGGLQDGNALEEALKRALPTIMTSGIILVTAGYIIGRRCSIYYIYSIGLLVSRGAFVSVVLVLTLLGALLTLTDPVKKDAE